MTELDMKDIQFFRPVWSGLEQTFLTYNSRTAAWDLAHYDTGEEIDQDGFALGITHWFELTDIDPEGIAERKAMRQEMFEEGGA